MQRVIFGPYVNKWRPTSELSPQMSYIYTYWWYYNLSGRGKEITYEVNIKTCPIFFGYGTEKAFFYHTEEWADNLRKDEKDGGYC